MKTSDVEIYGVLKMNASPCTDYVSYLNALKFWKAVEQKYQERKRQWMEANSRMVAAKLAAIRARKELDDAKRASGGGHLADTDNGDVPQSEDDFEDAREEEFSDVEAEMFADPGDRYFSSLDADKWNKIRKDLINIHRCTDSALEQRRRKVIRRILLATLIVFWLLVAGFFLLYMTNTHSHVAELLHEPTTACRLHCDQKTVIDDIVKMVFPPSNADDEV